MIKCLFNKQMRAESLPYVITKKLVSDDVVLSSLKCILWYGSKSNAIDVHKKSDIDLQIILAKPRPDVFKKLIGIMKSYPNVDLSVIYMHDIVDSNGNLLFQNGTKGKYFVYILATGMTLYGLNPYDELAAKLPLADATQSVVFTAREYITKLRVMALHVEVESLKFKKYSLKLLLDIAFIGGFIEPKKLSSTSYAEVLDIIMKNYRHIVSSDLTKSLNDISSPLDESSASQLLHDLEMLVVVVIHDRASIIEAETKHA